MVGFFPNFWDEKKRFTYLVGYFKDFFCNFRREHARARQTARAHGGRLLSRPRVAGDSSGSVLEFLNLNKMRSNQQHHINNENSAF